MRAEGAPEGRDFGAAKRLSDISRIKIWMWEKKSDTLNSTLLTFPPPQLGPKAFHYFFRNYQFLAINEEISMNIHNYHLDRRINF